MLKTKTIIRPEDHGRRMTLEDFEPAQVREGYLYELSRGVITVSDVPNYRHLRQVSATRRQFFLYQEAYPDQIHEILGTMECKLLLPDWESERHPDLAIYKKPPPKGNRLWWSWIPEIVIEIVSASSKFRDYFEKRQEYLSLGVKEYWLIDARKKEVLVLRRSRGKWSEQVVRPPEVYETKLLPGFRFECQKVFQAAGVL